MERQLDKYKREQVLQDAETASDTPKEQAFREAGESAWNTEMSSLLVEGDVAEILELRKPDIIAGGDEAAREGLKKTLEDAQKAIKGWDALMSTLPARLRGSEISPDVMKSVLEENKAGLIAESLRGESNLVEVVDRAMKDATAEQESQAAAERLKGETEALYNIDNAEGGEHVQKGGETIDLSDL